MSNKYLWVLCIYISCLVVLSGLAGCKPAASTTQTKTTTSTPAITSVTTSATLTSTITTLSTTTESTTDMPMGMRFPDVNEFLIIKYDSNGGQIWQNIEDFGEKNTSVSLNLDESGNSYNINANYNVKYDNNGKQVYFNTLTNNTIMTPKSVLDAEGNIYVIAEPDTSGINVFKYDKNGKQVWAEQYQYPGDLITLPSGIRLDHAGNIYITGFTSTQGAASSDSVENKLLILKFDNQGNLLSSMKDGGPMQGTSAIGPALDNNGNIYVTGFLVTNPVNPTSPGYYIENYEYVTVKYDAKGTKQWENYYHGPVNDADIPHDIKVDSGGNVIVTGESGGLGNIPEIATIKYDTDGKELWVNRYDENNGRGGTPSAMTIDDQGNIYITGRSFNNSLGDNYITIKYDSSGRQLWDAMYDGTGNGFINEANALFVDNNGNVYVTGKCGQDSQYVTYDTIKYSPDGNKLWVASYSKTNFIDRPDKLMVDALGNVYLIGRIASYSK